MALASYALVDWQTVRDHLGLDDSEQAKAELVINAASETANRYAERKLAATDYTHTLDGSGREELRLPQYPVNSITSVHVDVDREFGSDTEVTDYLTYSDEGILVRTDAGTWPSARQSVRVVYNAGYSTVPSELQIAVLEVVDYNWRRLASRSIGTRSMSGEGVTTEFELTIPTNAQRVFEGYRRRDAV
jgi:hypothetical protein